MIHDRLSHQRVVLPHCADAASLDPLFRVGTPRQAATYNPQDQHILVLRGVARPMTYRPSEHSKALAVRPLLFAAGFPTEVTRQSSAAVTCGPLAERLIVRSLYITKVLPPKPIRVCRKTTGPRELIATANADKPMTGAERNRPATAKTTSAVRGMPGLYLVVVGSIATLTCIGRT